MPKHIQRRAAAALVAWGLASSALAQVAPISKTDPEFPREALLAGAEKGRVKARMTVDAGGEVTRVEIVEATPRRLFERVVVKTLSQWKFAPGAANRSMEIEIEFHR